MLNNAVATIMLVADDYHHKRNKRSRGALTLWKIFMSSRVAIATSGVVSRADWAEG